MPGARRPTGNAVTTDSVRPRGTDLVAAPDALDPQSALLADLVAVMTRDIPSVPHLLDVTDRRLRDVVGLASATVCTLDPEDGRLLVADRLGTPADDDLVPAGRVFRTAAGAPPVVHGDRLAVRLRAGGQTVGVLVLRGSALGELRPDTVAAIALAVATTLQAVVAEGQRQFITHAGDTIRRLFEDGTVAASVEVAGELLARATAKAFRTERAALHLIDGDGQIRHAVGVGLSPEQSAALSRSLVGKMAAGSPVWRAAQTAGGPVLVEDVAAFPVRPGGFVETMGLLSYVAMPLMSAGGPVGMVICGDAGGTRHWSGRDRELAQTLAVEGALIVDSARMRQAEQVHVAELTRQAFHDALTGLPNRSHLLDRAHQAVEIAGPAGGRAGLLLIDLDGFKAVNDTAGHHAGDLLLRAVADRLLGAVRDGDLVARLGGDEFAILLTSDPDEENTRSIAERVHQRLREPFRIEEQDITIGGSVGIALFPDHAADVGELIRAADAPMYRAKRDGGGIRVAS
jgi:diguanylate cyclase (GGDEF)-like protein